MISTVRSPRPYQPLTLTRRQPFFGLIRRSARLVWRVPMTQGRPTVPGWPSGWRIEEARVQMQAGDHAGATAHRVQQVDGGVAAVGHANNLATGQPPRRLQQPVASQPVSFLCRR